MDDLQLSIDKNFIFTEDIFPLELDQELCNIFQHSFNYEIQFGNMQDSEYGYSVIPNYRTAIMMVDFIYSELKVHLNSKAEVQKSTGHSLVGSIKKLKKRAEMVENEIKELKRYVEERHQEISNIDQNIHNLGTRKEETWKRDE